MKYRVKHLLKALEEKDDGSGAAAPKAAAGGQVTGKMYITGEGSSSYQMNMVQVITQLLGCSF